MTDSVAAQFAEIISNMTVESVRTSVSEAIRWRMLDALAATLIADVTPCAGQYRAQPDQANAAQADNNALQYLQVHPILSALTNGAMLDLRRHRLTAHGWPVALDAAIIPAAWAQVQACEGSGQSLMDALVAGYTATDMLQALARVDVHWKWNAGLCSGTVGAAVAAARASNLTAPAMLNAMGFAAAQAAQLAENATTASCVKANAGAYGDFHDAADLPGPGRAAMDGVLCAQMAALGARCPSVFIEQLQAAIGSVNLHSVMTDAWSAAARRLAENAKSEAIRGFRKQVAAVIGASQTQALIDLVQRLEHAAPGELMSHLTGRIGLRQDC